MENSPGPGDTTPSDAPGVIPDSPPRIDARTAAWISSCSPLAAGHCLYSGVPLPARDDLYERPLASGGDWFERCAAAVLRECYRVGALDAGLEAVEVAALRTLPEPIEEDDESPAFLGSPARERWERAVERTARRVSALLRHGPTAGFERGEVVHCGELEVEVRGMLLRQRADLIWRDVGGSLEVVIVDCDPDFGRPPAPPEEDWSCILAAAAVYALYGVAPRVHVVRLVAGVAQVIRLSPESLERRVLDLRAAVAAAADPDSPDESFTYPVTLAAVEPLCRGEWPGGPRRPPRPPRP